MFGKKILLLWVGVFAALGFLAVMWFSAGRNMFSGEKQTYEDAADEEFDDVDDEFLNICRDIYKNAAEVDLGDLESVRRIVAGFGEKGYSAVDSENQVDMTEPKQAEDFCEAAKSGKEAEIDIIKVCNSVEFEKYNLHTKDGEIDVSKRSYKYDDGNLYSEGEVSYKAENWSYTDEGYLMFSGRWFSENAYVLGLSVGEEYAAFRIQPLDEVYRELNRKYIQPVGYKRNNLFLTDWNEDSFDGLDFYDMFDVLYPLIYGKSNPYTADINAGVGAVYEIPKDEFEKVIGAYFDIDSEQLQSLTTYYPEKSVYEYKPRGYFEAEYPEYPFSEAVGFEENADGTISLTVNAVLPYEGSSKYYTHETVVRPLENGGFRFVSNRIVPSENSGGFSWYKPRLTDTEWEEIYGEK